MIRSALTGGLVDALGGGLVFAGALVAMALLDLGCWASRSASSRSAVVCVVVASARVQTLTRASQEAVGRVAAGVERALSGVRTIRAAGATEREGLRLEADAEEAYRLGVRIARIGAVLWPVSGLAVQGAFLAVLGVGGYRVAAGTLSVADLVTFIIFLFMMLLPLGTAFSAVVTVRSALGALARIQEILALPAEDGRRRPAPTPRRRAARPRPVRGSARRRRARRTEPARGRSPSTASGSGTAAPTPCCGT